MTSMEFETVAAVAVAATAAVLDLRTRRIPNYLTFGAAGAALIYGFATSGVGGLGQASAGWLVGALLFFPLFALGGMGAGDVKLLAALGAWLGAIDAVWVALFASMAGGVMALIVALYHGYLRQAVSNVWLMLTHWRIAGLQPIAGFTLRDSRAPRLAYAIPIAVGVVCTLWHR